jgi:hypothetical protein
MRPKDSQTNTLGFEATSPAGIALCEMRLDSLLLRTTIFTAVPGDVLLNLAIC